MSSNNGDSTPRTEIVRASQMAAVIDQIISLRFADRLAEYEKEMAAYERALKKGKKELRKTEPQTTMQKLAGEQPTTEHGYQVLKRSKEGIMDLDWVKKPSKPIWRVWKYHNYDRSFGFTTHAGQSGFLSDPEVNRDIKPRRVEEYAELMEKGLWRDLLSDPIAITADGHVVNGQHRLAAVANVEWSEVKNDPQFLVVWGVSPEEAVLADTNKRTAHDQATITNKILVTQGR